MTSRHFVWAMLAVAALAGCASDRKGASVPFESDWEPSGKRRLTQPIALIADTQIHESRAVASRYFNRSGDEFVPVTLRTGQQVIGAADVLLHAMNRAKSYPLVLHGGDAIDISCATEWNLFLAAMSAAGRPEPGPTSWLFAPGNHDGFLTGNMYPMADGAGDLYVESYWRNLCNAGRVFVEKKHRHAYMPKEQIVASYEAMLEKHGVTTDQGRTCNTDGSLCWATRIKRGDLQWTSYVVQRVRIPSEKNSHVPVYAVLADSSDFAHRPYLRPSTLAGLHAGISVDQLRAMKQLVADLPPQARYFFVTHHPFKAWDMKEWNVEARALWNELNGDHRSLRFLVSAHTHEGSLRLHQDESGSMIELNTGSLSDAPVYLRSLWFEEDSKGSIGFRSAAIPLKAKESAPGCLSAAFPPRVPEHDYSVRGQDTESDRASKWPMPVRYVGAMFSALGHFLRFWSGKHSELRPQLLAYADVAERAIPPEVRFSYHPFGEFGKEENPIRPTVLVGGLGVADALRTNANCTSGAGLCSVQAKANLLLALENYFWFDPSTPQDVKAEAHRLRLCLALAATAESPHPDSSESERVNTLSREIGSDWAGKLLSK